MYAQLAALLEPRIRSVSLENRIGSISNWIKEPFYDETDSLSFILPGMLRHFDLPDADRWLAEEGRLDQAVSVPNDAAS
ncbi:hypothetical protein LJK88_17350 [Paenibacillus sp. P26]|nr:hypothetical protein LJK88_17350 [Paenibacillus sp. P26]